MDTSVALVSRETISARGLPPAGDPPVGGGNKRQKSGRKVRRLDTREEMMRVGSWNVNGVNEEQKRREIVNEFNESGMDVLGLQETHLLGEGVDGRDSRWEGLKGWACWSGMSDGYKGKKKMGVALLMSERMSETVVECKSVNARICWVLCKVGINKIAFVSAYAPVNAENVRGRKEMDEFWCELNECVKNLQKSGKVVLLGDMNAKVGSVEIERIVGKWGVDGVNENGEHLVGLCAERRMFLANTFFQHKQIHRFTWCRAEGSSREQKSLIDYVVLDESMRRWVQDARVVRGLFEGSDHRAVVVKMRVKMKWVGKKVVARNVERVDWQRLKEERVKEKYIQELGKLNVALEETEYKNDVEKIWSDSCSGILEIVERVCGTKKSRNGKRGDAWWSADIGEGVKRKKLAWKRTLQKNLSNEEKERRKREYQMQKNEVKRMVRDAKKKKDEELGRKLSNDFVSNRKLYHREIKKIRGEQDNIRSKIRDKDGSVLENEKEVLGRWKEYFSNLMNPREDREAKISCWGMVQGGGRIKEQKGITKKEIRRAVGKLKLGKAPGSDGVRAEMLKYGGEPIIDILMRVCQAAWETERVPESWTLAVIVPLYKGKGCRDLCASYRGISLLSVPGKVYGRVVIERVKEITRGKIGEEQGGFIEGRGCIDQIFTVKMMAEKYIGKRKKLYAAFMDLEKAYDRVDRRALWDVLKIYGVGGKLLNAVKAFYENCRAKVRVNYVESESFSISVGVKQGCVMSPWLFNIFMDGVMKEWKMRIQGEGAELNENGKLWKVPSCLYADDAVLFAESEEKLQRMVSEFNCVCERRKLKVNAGKSKVMVFERREYDTLDFGEAYRVRRPNVLNCKIRIGKEQLEEVSEFKYLGSVLCKNDTLESEIRERTIQGRKAIGELGSVVKGRSLSVEVKKNLRDSIVLPTLTYGSEVWKWNVAEQSKIRAVEMTYLRAGAGITRLDRVSNEEVYEGYGMMDKASGVNCGVVEWVKRNALRWYGHVRRMPEERMTKRVYQSEVSGMAGRGRPPVTWEGKIEQYLGERVTGGRRAIEAAKRACTDRIVWRPFCHGHPPGWELPGRARRRR